MAQSTILAAGNTAAVSTDITVAAGEQVIVGIFSAEDIGYGNVPRFSITQKTPGADNYVGSLSNSHRATVLTGPGTYRVRRAEGTGPEIGVFLET